jgi:hypothetical protein
MAVLCFAPPLGSTPIGKIVKEIVGSGRAWISTANFERRQVIRACVTHGETSEADIAELVDALASAAATEKAA